MAILSSACGAVHRSVRFAARRRTALAGIVCACIASTAVAVESGLPEERVKAAFLYNFARFVEWPAGAVANGEALVISVLGDDAFGEVVARTVDGKTIHGSPLEVRLAASVDDIAASHVVYVGLAAGGETDKILAALADGHVLTVSEVDEFVGHGGVIGLFKSDNKLRFRINIGAARNAGLEVSSKLLGLAEVVQGPVVRVEK